jgi:hypothetical protein
VEQLFHGPPSRTEENAWQINSLGVGGYVELALLPHASRGRTPCDGTKACRRVGDSIVGRTSDTRARVRQVASELARQGIDPTYKRVADQLGRGSPNTIGDELRKWRSEQALPASVPEALPTPPNVHASAPTPVDAARLEEVALAIPALVCALTSTQKSLEHLEQSVVSLRDAFGKELDLVSSRFDAVQRRTLLMVDEARESARYWKEEAARAKTHGRDTEEGYRRAMYAAQEQAARLAGQLEALMSPTFMAVGSAAPSPRPASLQQVSAPSGGPPRPPSGEAQWPQEADPDGPSE